MKRNNKLLFLSTFFIVAFILWTILISTVDVFTIGPNNSNVGFSTFNNYIREIIGTNFVLYIITDWLSLISVFTALCFALLGLCQLIKRKSILKVDKNIMVLGLFYIAVIFVYVAFEYIVINYRPVLINGYLEASYPSSTTMLVLTVMTTAIMQINFRIKNKPARCLITLIIALFIAFMLIGRVLSGVHWITDIIGGSLISTGLILLYRYFAFD